jgi:hypothetical protein
MKGVQATGETFSSQKKTSSTSKHKNLLTFSFLWVILPSCIRIQATQTNADPDPQHRKKVTVLLHTGNVLAAKIG